MDRLQALRDAGQSIWIDDITRRSLDEGALKRYVEEYHVTGLTSNPTILNAALNLGNEYDEQIRSLASRNMPSDEVFFALALEDLKRAADLFRAVHEQTGGLDGWASLEVSPLLADDAAASAAQAQRLAGLGARENLYIKIPGTKAGLAAIEECTFVGVPINVTLLFSTEQYLGAAEAYMRGVERRVEAGLSAAVSSVASLFVSRWDRAVADRVPPALRNRLGIAIAGQTYEAYRALLQSDRWLRLANHGARPQRLLWASTGAKDPHASDVLYIEALVAPFTVNTMPLKTLLAFADHGEVRGRLSVDATEERNTLAEFRDAGIDLDVIAERLQVEGAEDFARSWTSALEAISRKREEFVARAS